MNLVHAAVLAAITGRFRLKGRDSWMPAEVWQYNTAVEIARIFHMRIDFARVVPMAGRDVHLRGSGTMHGKLLGLVTVARSGGGKRTSASWPPTSTTRSCWHPRCCYGQPFRSWPLTTNLSDVTLSDSGQTVTARVSLDDHAHPVNFSTTDRFADVPGGFVRAEWTTPIDGWRRGYPDRRQPRRDPSLPAWKR